MSTKRKFTPEEIKNLKANPYTLRVTEDTISYTLEFKEAFWELSLQGYTATAAFRKLGYNTEVLGFERIHNTSKRLRQAGKSMEGFHEGNLGGVRIKSNQNSTTDLTEGQISAESARRMQKEIVCLQQQMAFLKKVMKLHEKQENNHGYCRRSI